MSSTPAVVLCAVSVGGAVWVDKTEWFIIHTRRPSCVHLTVTDLE